MTTATQSNYDWQISDGDVLECWDGDDLPLFTVQLIGRIQLDDVMRQALIDAFESGREYGVKQGRWQLQHDLRKLLDVPSIARRERL